MSTSLAEVLDNLQQAEHVVRIGIVLSFAFSMFLNGIVLQRRDDFSTKVMLKIARIAFFLGTALIIAFCTLALVSPMKSVASLANTGIALVLAIISLAIERDSPGAPALHFLSGALIFLITVVTSFVFPGEPSLLLEGLSGLTLVHIATAITGEGLFVVAFCGSLLYMWDYRRLKAKTVERGTFLPGLDTLDRIIEKTSLIGLFLITTSLISGLAITFRGASLISVGYAKLAWAVAVWAWYVLIIFGREYWGWRGKKGAVMSIFGTGFLVIALFGTVWVKI